MKETYVILSSQEFDIANHQELWKELSRQSNSTVIVVNIPADYVASIIKGRFWRIKEARKPAIQKGDNFFLLRPLLLIRPEICPSILHHVLARQLWECLQRTVPDILEGKVNLLVYNAYWVKILKGTHPNMSVGYYLFDEVRFNAHDNSLNRKRYKDDEFACRNSDFILTMTQKLAESRKCYNSNIIVIGNGAVCPSRSYDGVKIQKSVAFIGNFRNWIDKELLSNIIERKPDVLFAFVGLVEDNMRDYLQTLLNNYRNTAYFGKVSKEKMNEVYRMFNCIIVPYLQNEFIQATRPIKIVESVLAGTPVVTIPMDGYQPSEFIRFATNADKFCKEIGYLLDYPIDIMSKEYRGFVYQNTWESKASKIIEYFKL